MSHLNGLARRNSPMALTMPTLARKGQKNGKRGPNAQGDRERKQPRLSPVIESVRSRSSERRWAKRKAGVRDLRPYHGKKKKGGKGLEYFGKEKMECAEDKIKCYPQDSQEDK